MLSLEIALVHLKICKPKCGDNLLSFKQRLCIPSPCASRKGQIIRSNWKITIKKEMWDENLHKSIKTLVKILCLHWFWCND